ncbi:MAG: hypothetical protein ACRCTQ_00780 [Brevinemataceae bacterium]
MSRKIYLVGMILSQCIVVSAYSQNNTKSTNYSKIIKVEVQKSSASSTNTNADFRQVGFNVGKDGTYYPIFSPNLSLGYISSQGNHDLQFGIFLDFNIGRSVYFHTQLFTCYTTSINTGILNAGLSFGMGWYFIRPPQSGVGLSLAMNGAVGIGFVSQGIQGLLIRPYASLSIKYHFSRKMALNVQPYFGVNIMSGQFSIFSFIGIGLAI